MLTPLLFAAAVVLIASVLCYGIMRPDNFDLAEMPEQPASPSASYRKAA